MQRAVAELRSSKAAVANLSSEVEELRKTNLSVHGTEELLEIRCGLSVAHVFAGLLVDALGATRWGKQEGGCGENH